MELRELTQYLTLRQVKFTEKEIQHGKQIVCSTGEIFSHYPKRGKVVIGGKNSTPLAQAIKQWSDSGVAPNVGGSADEGDDDTGAILSGSASQVKTTVFVVYGHDIAARDKLELLLRRMGLDPIVLANLTPDGETIIEKLEKYLGTHSNVGYAVVLLTPDDEGHVKGDPDSKKYRARQNVILELGMVLGRLGRSRVAILHKGSVELPSDINGLLYMAFEESVDEVGAPLYRQLEAAGYPVNFP